ncbi:hypothetical protein ABJI51_35430 [Amycolatopsis sp. NEAU-NG30]|uniref:Uncharacterized protein n=1 Tax=Amycolatopsis melonis TaxID=3156488 RepID=A0ABV0LQ22_9PSEU
MSPIESAANAKSAELEPLAGGSSDDLGFWFNVRAAVDHVYARIITHGFHFATPAPEGGPAGTCGMSVGELLRVR